MVVLDTGFESDLPEVRRLLAESGLPLDGLMEVPTRVVVARDGDRVVGAGALEVHGRDGLLRSLVVAPLLRTAGIGSAIVTELERIADESGLAGTYLLTETAERFFARRGYHRIGRNDAPEDVMRSVEWSVACDDSAVPMAR